MSAPAAVSYTHLDVYKRQALLLQTPSSLKARFGIDVRVDSEAMSIDRAAKSVTVRNLATNEQYHEGYDLSLIHI